MIVPLMRNWIASKDKFWVNEAQKMWILMIKFEITQLKHKVFFAEKKVDSVHKCMLSDKLSGMLPNDL